MHTYQCTPFEQWIEQLYCRIGTTEPKHLNIIDLAAKLNIWIYFMDMKSQAVERNGLYSICVDRRLHRKEQWEDFLHELGHVLCHSGRQFDMPGEFIDWQETQANNFQLYAAIPFFMLKQIKLPVRESELVEFLSFNFDVTYSLAQRRVEQIQRRILQGRSDFQTMTYIESKRRKYSPSNWSEETRRIMNKLQQLEDRKYEVKLVWE